MTSQVTCTVEANDNSKSQPPTVIPQVCSTRLGSSVPNAAERHNHDHEHKGAKYQKPISQDKKLQEKCKQKINKKLISMKNRLHSMITPLLYN